MRKNSATIFRILHFGKFRILTLPRRGTRYGAFTRVKRQIIMNKDEVEIFLKRRVESDQTVRHKHNAIKRNQLSGPLMRSTGRRRSV